MQEHERWFNRSILVDTEGKVVAHYDKIHLFDACFGENRFYRESARICPGDQVTVAETPWGKMGMTVCYDVRFPHLYRDLAKYGVEILAIPATFARVTGKRTGISCCVPALLKTALTSSLPRNAANIPARNARSAMP